jgi:hypothetical protein
MTWMPIPFLVVPRPPVQVPEHTRATRTCPMTAKEEGEWPTNP